MYAIVRAGGHQEKVSVGDEIEVNRVPEEPGATVELPAVMVVPRRNGRPRFNASPRGLRGDVGPRWPSRYTARADAHKAAAAQDAEGNAERNAAAATGWAHNPCRANSAKDMVS